MNRYERCDFCGMMQRFPGHYDVHDFERCPQGHVKAVGYPCPDCKERRHDEN